MRRRLSATTVAELHVGQVVTAGAIAQARIAREEAGGLGHFFNVIEHARESTGGPMAAIEVTDS